MGGILVYHISHDAKYYVFSHGFYNGRFVCNTEKFGGITSLYAVKFNVLRFKFRHAVGILPGCRHNRSHCVDHIPQSLRQALGMKGKRNYEYYKNDL